MDSVDVVSLQRERERVLIVREAMKKEENKLECLVVINSNGLPRQNLFVLVHVR